MNNELYLLSLIHLNSFDKQLWTTLQHTPRRDVAGISDQFPSIFQWEYHIATAATAGAHAQCMNLNDDQKFQHQIAYNFVACENDANEIRNSFNVCEMNGMQSVYQF